MAEKKIIIAHKDKVYLQMLHEVLIRNHFSNIQLVQSVRELVSACQQTSFDIIVVHDSLNLNRHSELIVSSHLRIKEAKIVLLTNASNIERFLYDYWSKASIMDYQQEGLEKLMKVMKSPLNESYLSPSFVSLVAKTLLELKPTYPGLTESDVQLLRYTCYEYTSLEIADVLHRSKRTIDSQRFHLRKVVGARSLVGLAIFAIEKGIYIPDSSQFNIKGFKSPENL